METTRQSKVGKLLQKELGALFLNLARNSKGSIISVSTVRVSPDLGSAKIYLSVFPSDRGKAILKEVKDRHKEIRYDLGQKVRHQLRIVPELFFYLDDSLDYIENIDSLLQQDSPA